jgi:hypothetical protein
MKPNTIDFIVETLTSEVSKNFTDKEIAIKVRTWNLKLKDIADADGLRALDELTEKKLEFMPSVGEFKQMCLSGPGCGSLEDSALEAWALVKKHLNAYIYPIFSDTAIAETIRKMGGWAQLCRMLEDEEPFRKKDFVQLYEINSRKKEDFPPMLSGQGKTMIKGKLRPDFKFIGFQSKEAKMAAWEIVKQIKQSDNKLLAMLGMKKLRRI